MEVGFWCQVHDRNSLSITLSPALPVTFPITDWPAPIAESAYAFSEEELLSDMLASCLDKVVVKCDDDDGGEWYAYVEHSRERKRWRRVVEKARPL